MYSFSSVYASLSGSISTPSFSLISTANASALDKAYNRTNALSTAADLWDATVTAGVLR